MRKIILLLVLITAFSFSSQAKDDWLIGVGIHQGTWLQSEDTQSTWTIKDKSGYLLRLEQSEGVMENSPVLYIRNTVLWDNAPVDGIARYSINKASSTLNGLYLGFGPRALTEWGSFYLNLGGLFANGAFQAKVEQAPENPAEGDPKKDDTVAVSFFEVAPAMEAGLDLDLGKLSLNLGYTLIGQKKIENYRFLYQRQTMELEALSGYLAPVKIGGSYLSLSLLYKF